MGGLDIALPPVTREQVTSPARAGKIRLISADAAEWIGDCALGACPNATLCLDPFLHRQMGQPGP